jgi:hypothetical protein
VLSVRKLYSNSLFFLQENYIQILCAFCKKIILKFFVLSVRKLYSNHLCFLGKGKGEDRENKEFEYNFLRERTKNLNKIFLQKVHRI